LPRSGWTSLIEDRHKPALTDLKVLPPASGIYHGAFPGFGETEDVVNQKAMANFESLARKPLAWAYFSNNWFIEQGERTIPEIRFPRAAVQAIWDFRKDNRVIPFVRLMARSGWTENKPDPLYTMDRVINDGAIASQIRQWADEAKRTEIPLMLEFGTEINNDFFPWNGKFNGNGLTAGYGDPAYPDGPERFQDAFRHVIELFRGQGVTNVTWVFHVDSNASPKPDKPDNFWNAISNYYPGDNYIEWLGASVYGPDADEAYESFENIFKPTYQVLRNVSEDKPIAILELGIDKHPEKARWITEALLTLKNKKFERVKAVSYWHSKDKDSGKTVDFRINSSKDSLKAYREGIADPLFTSKVSLS
jgi:hypothetical protein